MIKATPSGRYREKRSVMLDIFHPPLFFFCLCLSLSVLQSLMLGSQQYFSSQTTSGGASPVSLHVMSGARMQFLVPFFFLKKVGQEHEDFWKDRMTERHRGKEEMRRVNKRVSITFVTFCFLCLRDNHHFCTRLPSSWFLEENRQPTWGQTLFVFSPLVPFCLHTYITVSAKVNSIKVNSI